MRRSFYSQSHRYLRQLGATYKCHMGEGGESSGRGDVVGTVGRAVVFASRNRGGLPSALSFGKGRNLLVPSGDSMDCVRVMASRGGP